MKYILCKNVDRDSTKRRIRRVYVEVYNTKKSYAFSKNKKKIKKLFNFVAVASKVKTKFRLFQLSEQGFWGARKLAVQVFRTFILQYG